MRKMPNQRSRQLHGSLDNQEVKPQLVQIKLHLMEKLPPQLIIKRELIKE